MSEPTLEHISSIPEDHTFITKIPTASDILDGAAVADGADTTGGTQRFDDRDPTEIIDTPTEIDAAVKGVKKSIPYIAIAMIVIVFALFYFKKGK